MEFIDPMTRNVKQKKTPRSNEIGFYTAIY